MQKLFSILLLVFICLFNQACTSNSGGVEINYSETVKTKTVKTKDEKTTTSNFSLILGKDKFIIKAPSDSTMVDIDKKQIINIDNDQKSYFIMSLYAKPLFSAFEMKNREALRKLIETVKPKEEMSGLDVFNAESELGIKGNAPLQDKIYFEEQKESFGAKYKDKTVTKVKFSDSKLDARYKRSFNGALLFLTHLHPDIRKKIVKDSRIFKELFIEHKILDNITDTTFEMTGIKNEKTLPFDIPSNYKRAFSKDNRLNGLIQKMQDKSKMISLAQYEQRAKSLLNAKRYLEALLVITECAYQYGITLPEMDNPELLNFIRHRKSKDMDAVAKMQLLRPKDVQEVDRSVENVQYLINKKIEGYEVLYTNISNLYSYVGDHGKAMDFMYKALNINPFMATALGDLAKLYMNQYKFEDAFECCNQAEQIVHDHKFLKSCTALKEQGEKAFSEYFKM